MVWESGSEWVMCSWIQWHCRAIQVRSWGHPYNRFYEVTVVVAIIQVRITIVGIRVQPGMWIRVVDVMGAECKVDAW